MIFPSSRRGIFRAPFLIDIGGQVLRSASPFLCYDPLLLPPCFLSWVRGHIGGSSNRFRISPLVIEVSSSIRLNIRPFSRTPRVCGTEPFFLGCYERPARRGREPLFRTTLFKEALGVFRFCPFSYDCLFERERPSSNVPKLITPDARRSPLRDRRDQLVSLPPPA